MTPKDPADAGSPAPRRRSGQLESQIITVLVEAGRSLTPSEVLEVLNASTTLSYSTVVTTLTRLYKKGSVARRRHGRAYKYGAMADAPGLIAGRMSRLLSEEQDRASVLRRFVSALDPQDEELLRELLRDPEA